MLAAKVATLEEIERYWSIDDVLNANDLLDALEEAQIEAQKRP